MPKYQHRAKSMDEIPRDYLLRWDAARAGVRDGRVNYLTDEATNDVNGWEDETGLLDLAAAGVTTVYPTLTTDSDGKPAMYFAADGGLRAAFTGLTGSSCSTFAVMRINHADNLTGWISAYAGHGNATLGIFGISKLVDADAYGVSAANTPTYSTAAFTDRRAVVGQTITRNGVDDHDAAKYVGTTNIGNATTLTDAQVASAGIAMGMSYGTTNDMDGYLYEVLVWNRVLTAGERADVIEYLSNKWDCGNDDSASDAPSAPANTDRWQRERLDPQGSSILRHPGRVPPGQYSVNPLRDRNAPRAAGNNNFDESFPMTKWGALVNFWFDAAQVSDMTFDSGDAKAGGVVSSWTDVTGQVTMNTTASLDPAVDYDPLYKGKAPAMRGGTVASPKSLQSTATVSYSSVAGHQRLFWSVCGWEDLGVAVDAVGAGLFNNILFTAITQGFRNDLYQSPWTPPINYAGTSTGWQANGPMSVQNAFEGLHIQVFRVTKTGVSNEADIEDWYAGLRGRDRSSTTVGSGAQSCAVGALATSNFDSNTGGMCEMGAIDGAGTAFTDADVDELIHYLCNKYNIPFMPETTPLDIGLQHASTTITAQHDCVYWFRNDGELSDKGWRMHPKLEELRRVANSADGAGDVAIVRGLAGAREIDTSAGAVGLRDAAAYIWSESTIFPASSGYSSFAVATLTDAVAPVSSGYAFDMTGIQMRRNLATDQWLVRIASQSLISTNSYEEDPAVCIGTYDFTEQLARSYVNNEAVKSQASTVTTLSTTRPNIGQDSASSNAGDVRVSECAAWKHKLEDNHVEALKRYARHYYQDGFT